MLYRSGNSTAQIWIVPEGPCGLAIQSAPPKVVVFKYFKGRKIGRRKDMTTLDWNVSYAFLCYMKDYFYIMVFSFEGY